MLRAIAGVLQDKSRHNEIACRYGGEELVVICPETREDELQEFLYNHPWLFGTEYVNAEPQKLRGAHSKYDFYLERFNKTNDIVEIKISKYPLIRIK